MTQSKLIIYIMGSHTDIDSAVGDPVPYRVTRDQLFFGPCMKAIRRSLYAEHLASGVPFVKPTNTFYMIGLNRQNELKQRNILWAGRLNSVMTFEYAHNNLDRTKYRALFEKSYSPLHVKPTYNASNNFSGYKWNGQYHEEQWWEDLKWDAPSISGDEFLLPAGIEKSQYYDLDCCMLFERLFYAVGNAFSLDDEALAILNGYEPRNDRTVYTPFGYCNTKDGSKRIDGKFGHGYAMSGDSCDMLIDWVTRKSSGK